jgi:electron transport complex protein RnfE
MGERLKQLWNEFTKGFVKENPILVIMLGLCPTLAVSTSTINGLGMGMAFAFVVLGSNIVISLLRKFIPNEVRIPSFIVIISTFVTIADYSLKAYLPSLSSSLGVFVPLIVVNCIVMGRAESFACKNTVPASILDALGMSVGFTVVIALIGFIREILGNGTILVDTPFVIDLTKFNFQPFLLMILPPGAFLVIGFLMALKNKLFD